MLLARAKAELLSVVFATVPILFVGILSNRKFDRRCKGAQNSPLECKMGILHFWSTLDCSLYRRHWYIFEFLIWLECKLDLYFCIATIVLNAVHLFSYQVVCWFFLFSPQTFAYLIGSYWLHLKILTWLRFQETNSHLVNTSFSQQNPFLLKVQ